MRILRNVDLVVLALALPVWVAAQLPALGWIATSVAWLLSRLLQSFTERRAAGTHNRQVALGARAASLIGRLYLVGLIVLGAGVIERRAGLTAAVLSVIVFTVYLVSLLITEPMKAEER